MKVICSFILALLVCAALLGIGCTQPGTSATKPAATPTAPGMNLAPLALTQADVPANYTLVSQSAKDPAQVSKLASDLGWQGGYSARFAGQTSVTGAQSEIVQSIAVYPAGTIPDVIAMSDTQDRTDTDLTYTNFSPTTAGSGSRGFFGKAPAGIYIKPTNVNPLVTGSAHHDVSATVKADVAEVIFAKGNVFEVIRMTGPGASTEAVTALAEKAYAKIP